jgi:hypothetical protein
VQHLAGVGIGHLALGREVVRLVEDQVQRRLVGAVERAGEFGEPARALADRQLRGVGHEVHALLDQKPRDRSTAVRRQRQVAVVASEHEHREARALAVGRAPQAPPGARGIHDADPSPFRE